MLTLREVRQRLSLINARIQLDKEYGEYRVTLQEWPLCARRTEDKAYYTNDLEDALFTAQSMRREANSYGGASYPKSSEATLLGIRQPEKRYEFR